GHKEHRSLSEITGEYNAPGGPVHQMLPSSLVAGEKEPDQRNLSSGPRVGG
ncbi:MAG: hypothetical protein JWN69_307, partial [Alphaproteobacteria bacterium]|nr:hypothetical protein [Alphaproteobacteria bacterium]